MEDIITEKFALLNLIKALQGISSPPPPENNAPSAPENAASTPPPPESPVQSAAEYNAMASVLAKHEQISNRVKNKR